MKIGMPDFSKFADRDDERLAQHDLLVALVLHDLARAEQGAGPDETPELYPTETALPSRFTFPAIASREGDTLTLRPADPRFSKKHVLTVRSDAQPHAGR